MSRHLLPTLALAGIIAVTCTSHALAHCFVGARFLPVTLVTYDPLRRLGQVAASRRHAKNGGCAACPGLDLSFDFSKRITDNLRRNSLARAGFQVRLRPTAH